MSFWALSYNTTHASLLTWHGSTSTRCAAKAPLHTGGGGGSGAPIARTTVTQCDGGLFQSVPLMTYSLFGPVIISSGSAI